MMIIYERTVGTVKKARISGCIIFWILMSITIFILIGCSGVHKHTYSIQWSVDDNYHWHSDTCGHNTENEKSPHSFGSWEIIKSATISENGYETRVCTVCGYIEEKEIKKVIPQIYEIAYNLIGGTFLTSVATTYTYGTGISLPTEKDLAKEGYIFIGWKDSDNRTITEIPDTVKGDVELIAQWAPIEYTVTFNAEGKIVGTTKFTVEDSCINAPVIPEKVGYTSRWENYSIVAKDITVNAIYSKTNYKITYLNTKGVVHPNRTSYSIEDETIVLTDINKDGYIFCGWYDEDKKVESIVEGSYGDKTLTAKWTPIEYTATFKADGDVIGISKFNIEDSRLNNIPVIPEKIGFTSKWEEYVIEANDITVNAIYTLNEYKATFEVDGKVLDIISFTVKDAKINNEPIIPKKIGYKEQWEDYTLIAKDITINAVYMPITYTIQYLNIKGVENNNITEFNIETETFAVCDLPDINGYSFEGWYNEKNMVTQIDKGTVGNIELTAKWELKNFDIVYHLSNGINDMNNPDMYSVESDDIQLLPPSKNGYIFRGWFCDDDFSEQSHITKIRLGSYGSIDLYAKWEPITYTIVFNKNSDAAINIMPSQNVEYDTAVNLQANLYYNEGYIFLGWTENANGTGYKYNDADMVLNLSTEHGAEVEIFALWEIIEYEITYDLDSGSAANPATYTVESNIVLSNPTKEGYNFLGWTGSNGETPESNFAIESGSTGNLSFVAHWELCVYSISYKINGGMNAIKNPNYYTITDTIELHDAKKDYYTFDGWYTDSDYINEITSLYGRCGDLILYAKFTPYSYIAKYDAGDGELVYRVNLFYWENSEANKTLEFKDGDVFNPYSLETPVRDEYIFYAWYCDEDCTMPIDETLNVYADLYLFAKWVLKSDMKGYRKDAVELNYVSVNPYDIGKQQGNVPNYESKYFYVPYNYCGETTLSYNLYTSSYTTSSANWQKEHYGSYNVWLKDLTTEKYLFSKSAVGVKSSTSGTQKLELISGHYYQLYARLYGGYWPGSGCASLSVSATKETKNLSIVFTSEVNQKYDAETVFISANRIGYDFIGWYDSNNNLVTEVWNYTSDQIFHASWALHNYNINYNLFGGVNHEDNPSYYNLNNLTILLKNPAKNGYTFDGWYTDSNYNNKITIIEANECEDYILFAKWTANSYTVALDYDGGQIVRQSDFTVSVV